MQKGMYDAVQKDLDRLIVDLGRASQVDNPRSQDQLLIAKRMMARLFHLQHKWDEAIDA